MKFTDIKDGIYYYMVAGGYGYYFQADGEAIKDSSNDYIVTGVDGHIWVDLSDEEFMYDDDTAHIDECDDVKVDETRILTSKEVAWLNECQKQGKILDIDDVKEPGGGFYAVY